MGKGSKAVPAWANSTVVTKYLYKTVRMLKNEGLKQTVFAAKYVVGRYLKLKAIKKEFYLTKELRDEQERTVFPYMPKISRSKIPERDVGFCSCAVIQKLGTVPC